MFLALFLLLFFREGLVGFFAQATLDHDPLIYTSCIAGMADLHHHTQFIG
jgi:hypothetical protein